MKKPILVFLILFRHLLNALGKEEKKEERKKPQGKNIMACPIP